MGYGTRLFKQNGLWLLPADTRQQRPHEKPRKIRPFCDETQIKNKKHVDTVEVWPVS